MRETDQPAGGSLSDRVRSLRLGQRAGQRPPRSRWVPWIFCAVCLTLTAGFAWRSYRVGPLGDLDPDEVAARKAAGDTGSGGGTTISSSIARTGEVVLQAKGYVIPISLIQVSPKVGGQLVKITDGFEEGALFKEGDELARI